MNSELEFLVDDGGTNREEIEKTRHLEGEDRGSTIIMRETDGERARDSEIDTLNP